MPTEMLGPLKLAAAELLARKICKSVRIREESNANTKS